MKRRALIAIDLGDIHFLETYRAEACRGMLRYARGAGNWELLFNDHRLSLAGAFRRLDDLPGLGVRGALVCSWDRRKLGKARRLGIPIVSISNEYPQEGIPCVLSDDEAIGRAAAEHLMATGGRSLAFVGSGRVPWDAARRRGFEASVIPRGFAVNTFDAHHRSEPASIRDAGRRLCRWLKSLPVPTAVFCADDLHASQVLEAARRVGRHVPRDLAIVGVDNNSLICLGAIPALSSVEPNAEEVGYQAARLLAQMMGGRSVRRTPLLIAPRGVRSRASSDLLMTSDALVADALSFLRERFAEPIGAGEIAESLGVSRRTLETRFRAALGFTIGERLARERLSAAKEMLALPGGTIAAVAKTSGFGSPSHFCARFKEATGLTPGEYRVAGASAPLKPGNEEPTSQPPIARIHTVRRGKN